MRARRLHEGVAFGEEGRMTEAAIGRLAHQVLAELLAEPPADLSPREVIELVGGHPAVRSHTGRLGGARQLIAVMLSIYLDLFDRRPQWELLGSEVQAPGCQFDLVWRRGEAIEADELKTGRLARPAEVQHLDEQLGRQLRGGVKKFGDQFAGVRVISFGAPRLAFLARPSGERIALDLEIGR